MQELKMIDEKEKNRFKYMPYEDEEKMWEVRLKQRMDNITQELQDIKDTIRRDMSDRWQMTSDIVKELKELKQEVKNGREQNN